MLVLLVLLVALPVAQVQLKVRKGTPRVYPVRLENFPTKRANLSAVIAPLDPSQI